jgi:hypothetical protein
MVQFLIEAADTRRDRAENREVFFLNDLFQCNDFFLAAAHRASGIV